ncbi:transposase [Streptomyces sp. TRM72054]|uniref:transposase n=1 Tax=Streptomyces sp. TRM72054 TaxID=2870562 RepID=UPI0021AB35EE|nr:transposase [Streptomyces sp. TRM72054]
MADLPQGAVQSESNDVNRGSRPHPGTATLKELTAPDLLDLFGVGQDSAATRLIAAGDNPERLAHEAAFAALCGVSPVEMSSGKTQRRRLNRGGNRQANAALFRVILTHIRCHPETRAYLQRRTAEGRTKREIIRCLKRYLARQIYKIIRASLARTTPASAAA